MPVFGSGMLGVLETLECKQSMQTRFSKVAYLWLGSGIGKDVLNIMECVRGGTLEW
jgi:hypothetical protein